MLDAAKATVNSRRASRAGTPAGSAPSSPLGGGGSASGMVVDFEALQAAGWGSFSLAEKSFPSLEEGVQRGSSMDTSHWRRERFNDSLRRTLDMRKIQRLIHEGVLPASIIKDYMKTCLDDLPTSIQAKLNRVETDATGQATALAAADAPDLPEGKPMDVDETAAGSVDIRGRCEPTAGCLVCRAFRARQA